MIYLTPFSISLWCNHFILWWDYLTVVWDSCEISYSSSPFSFILYTFSFSLLIYKLSRYSEFKPVKFRLKIDLVSYPARAEGMGKYGYSDEIPLMFPHCSWMRLTQTDEILTQTVEILMRFSHSLLKLSQCFNEIVSYSSLRFWWNSLRVFGDKILSHSPLRFCLDSTALMKFSLSV